MKLIKKINSKNTIENMIVNGDASNVLKDIPKESINLIVTSPPYADKRNKTYSGIKADDYVEWFLPIADLLYNSLKSDGSFILNIKENVHFGERHTYVLELILALKKQGWLWTEEYVWHKKNSFPGKWPNRFRDSWERCLHFTKEKKFYMNQESVMVPMGDWKDKRFKSKCKNDSKRIKSNVGNNLTKKITNWIDRKKAYPDNVLHLATECGNKNHSAAFPIELPSWFIKLFSRPGDLVMDPFLGSGTSAVAALELDRRYLGIELKEEYANIACERLKKSKLTDIAQKKINSGKDHSSSKPKTPNAYKQNV